MAKTKIKKVLPQVDVKPSILEKYVPCEWMIQFDDDTPQLFAYSDKNSTTHEVVFKIPNTSESHVSFTDPNTNKRFRIFARPRS